MTRPWKVQAFSYDSEWAMHPFAPRYFRTRRAAERFARSLRSGLAPSVGCVRVYHRDQVVAWPSDPTPLPLLLAAACALASVAALLVGVISG